PGANLPKSESDEFSDLTSDLDFDELASERSRPDGGSSTDESYRDGSTISYRDGGTVSYRDGSTVSLRKENKKQKHRPKSLTLSRSHTPSDEEDGPSTGGSDGTAEPQANVPQDETNVGSKVSADQRGKKHSLAPDNVSRESNVSLLQDSPTPPRSPSWREGLDSPPFSPRRRDSYPGKRRGSLSPKDKKNHFTYTDMSPPSRQLSIDELYGECSGECSASGSYLDNGVAGSQVPQKPSPISPEEIKDSLFTIMGENVPFDIPSCRAKPPTSIGAQLHHNDFQTTFSMPHSAPVMDLATYAATIANSTASLTSMSVSPTNLLPHNTHHLQMAEPMSPDSADSSCSSPVSPGYYDNAQPANEEAEDVELADPSSKSIDFQGSKRQKARPPSTDWSPVIDLSPILDVSPSVEEAEQEDMLAKQMEELERQRSLNAAQEDEDDETGEIFEKSYFENKSVTSPVKTTPPQAVIPRIPPPPSAKKLKQQLNEDYDEDEESLEDGGTFLFGNTLRRCGNFEDISRLGSDSSVIKNTSDLVSDDRLVDDFDTHENESFIDTPFVSCTSQASGIPQSTQGLSSTVSIFLPPSRPISQSEEHGCKQLRVYESMISDEIHKITEDMENIVKSGAANMKPIPPPKPKRRLPDPEVPCFSSDFAEMKLIPSIRTEAPSESGSQDGSFEEGSSGKHLPRQDSGEKKKAKDLKAKPSPILIQHIESEEQSVSPHYKVMESPPTPETKTIKREFSDSTSVSPNSSPDQDVYAFPSPVTPPDSDSSPPKPHSPSSPGTDLDEDVDAGLRGSYCFRSASPYDNAKLTYTVHMGYPAMNHVVYNTSGTEYDGSTELSQESQGKVHESGQDTQVVPQSHRQENLVRPPISPRRSIIKFNEQKLNGKHSHVYEHVKDVCTQEYSDDFIQGSSSSVDEYFQGSSSSMEEYKLKSLGLSKKKGVGDLDISSKLAAPLASQHTDIFTYPVVGEFTGRSRSSSAPFTAINDSNQPEVPPVRPRSASADQEQVTSSSVRDKIRAFEEPPVPRKRVSPC
ncbi:hypothetical protein Btru_052221, partial [Bulinus truncatus]